jgi:hypothetical protein
MIQLMEVDTSGNVPCPEVDNPMLSKLRGLKTNGGVSLAGKFPELTLTLNDGYETPPGLVDYFRVGLLKVVSSKLKVVFDSEGAELEYFPVTVLYRNEPTSSQYFVANPLKRIKAIDLGESEVELDDEVGMAWSVKKLIIDESKFNGIKLAVIAEIQRIGLQPDLALAVQLSGCTGCTFINPITVRY